MRKLLGCVLTLVASGGDYLDHGLRSVRSWRVVLQVFELASAQRVVVRAVWGLATFLGLGSPALAGDCRLALVLALDVSSSVDAAEDRLQREGLARALLAPRVVRAFEQGASVAVYVFEWSGRAPEQATLPGWQLVESERDLMRIARAIAHSHARPGYRPHSSTALGGALRHAAAALEAAPDCHAQIVDIAGDGQNNIGIEPQVAYELTSFNNVTVNALIVGEADDSTGLVAWFQAEVLHGPGAFWILADGYDDYERAMAAKLERELELPLVSGMLLAGGGA
jgi:hypothetical protein